MAAFIVISADNRLHYLVDGIEKCRPLNPNVPLDLSTGKIIKKDSAYTYQYTIHGEPSQDDVKETPFCSLLKNQLAAFRKKFTIPKDQLVNIFYLESPLTEDDLTESESWIEAFDEVYCGGQGADTSFCLYRIVFSYDHANPTDVESQIDVATLRQLLEHHREVVSCGKIKLSERYFERYLFYVDNQDSDSAALCLDKEEHDLKMPRFLLDFMMLASNAADSYNVVSSINFSNVNTRCFSVGFAESMYYYPDVERYYKYADERDLYGRFLKDADEMENDQSKESMDIEKHPFGLRNRENRLGQYYEDVPFTEDIRQYQKSSDYRINSCIQSLRELIEQERDKEYKDFCNSPKVIALKDKIEDINNQMKNAAPEEIEEFLLMKGGVAKELDDLTSSFDREYPPYIDRNGIYIQLCTMGSADKQELVKELTVMYNNIVNFVKSKKFLDYIETTSVASCSAPNSENQDENGGNTLSRSQSEGCLYRLFHWHKEKKVVAAPVNVPVLNPKEQIVGIVNEQELKREYVRFKSDVGAVESRYGSREKYCEDFKLTEHTNHYYPLIDLEKLRLEQSKTFPVRIDKSISEWRKEITPTKSSLVELVGKSSTQYTKESFSYVDWNNPFSFVKDLSDQNRLADICNALQKKASPFVNYNLTSELKENKVVRHLYSDRPNFEDEIKSIRTKLDNGNEISALHSKHIASKISMMQILPLDDEVLDNLVDLVGT